MAPFTLASVMDQLPRQTPRQTQIPSPMRDSSHLLPGFTSCFTETFVMDLESPGSRAWPGLLTIPLVTFYPGALTLVLRDIGSFKTHSQGESRLVRQWRNPTPRCRLPRRHLTRSVEERLIGFGGRSIQHFGGWG
jgi:hypothetical protein